MSKEIKKAADLTPDVMRMYGELIKNSTPDKMGFALVLFDFGDKPGAIKYVSNANRTDMIEAFEDLVSKWKLEQSLPKN